MQPRWTRRTSRTQVEKTADKDWSPSMLNRDLPSVVSDLCAEASETRLLNATTVDTADVEDTGGKDGGQDWSPSMLNRDLRPSSVTSVVKRQRRMHFLNATTMDTADIEDTGGKDAGIKKLDVENG